jgi:hypothetical protein
MGKVGGSFPFLCFLGKVILHETSYRTSLGIGAVLACLDAKTGVVLWRDS